MKDLYRILPPFAPDYGGACEVMYELGGLVLIHDASGCTVNYVSFDEPRWHEKPGYVYCSGLTEIDAVMGNDDVLIEKALRAAETLHPNFIAFVGSSVPMIVGTDFEGIARETEERSGIPSFGFDCNGIRSYTEGAGKVLLELVQRFTGEKTESRGILLLGQLPLDDNGTDASARLKAFFPTFGPRSALTAVFRTFGTRRMQRKSLSFPDPDFPRRSISIRHMESRIPSEFRFRKPCPAMEARSSSAKTSAHGVSQRRSEMQRRWTFSRKRDFPISIRRMRTKLRRLSRDLTM